MALFQWRHDKTLFLSLFFKMLSFGFSLVLFRWNSSVSPIRGLQVVFFELLYSLFYCVNACQYSLLKEIRDDYTIFLFICKKQHNVEAETQPIVQISMWNCMNRPKWNKALYELLFLGRKQRTDIKFSFFFQLSFVCVVLNNRVSFSVPLPDFLDASLVSQ